MSIWLVTSPVMGSRRMVAKKAAVAFAAEMQRCGVVAFSDAIVNASPVIKS